jgi:hypothetical protein
MAGEGQYSVRGDRALQAGDEDKLGFRDVASRIATSLVDRASEDGLVIGLEGAWGSGKSSLLFLIADELGKLAEEKRPTVINFRPWLIGHRDALITSLFRELSAELDRVALAAGDAAPITIAKAKKASAALRAFMLGLSGAGAVIEVAGEAVSITPVAWFGKALKAVGEWSGRKPAVLQLSTLKDKLAGSLRGLGHRFIITIDDVDRLEPVEVIEILRLVRSVVDLPNVIYLLCYDSEILAHSIENATGVKNGRAYLEKIVQLTVMVPQPELLQLRQWLTDALHGIASAKDDDELSRLKTVIDYEGGRQLKTPRSVVRALDAIRFFWPPLREAGADLADLVWLQLIKDGNPSLYRWIEEYCATAAVISLGTARVETGESARLLDRLFATVPAHHFDDTTYRYNFAGQLPGVELDYREESMGLKLFNGVHDHVGAEAIRRRRLASPDHWRLYFALAGPSHALTQDSFTTMWTAAEAGATDLGMALLQLNDQQVAGTLSKADILLDRVKGGAYELLSARSCENFLLAMSQVMDEAFRRRPFDQRWFNSLWDRALDLIPVLLPRLEETQRHRAIDAMFGEGPAIGWLTKVFRHETFAHGRFGSHSKPQEQLFTNDELDRIAALMIERYRQMSADEVFAVLSPISVLYAWRQGGDEEGARDFVIANIASDEGLLRTLKHFAATIYTGDRRTYQVLKKDDIGLFMDTDAAIQRLQALIQDPVLGDSAKWVLDAFETGNSF